MFLKDGKRLFTMPKSNLILFDAGLFIAALLNGDTRHLEARPLVEVARTGKLTVCTTVSILSEVYVALTWINTQSPPPPDEVAEAVRLLGGAPLPQLLY
jgi:predicted nucleic acid-binding protein